MEMQSSQAEKQEKAPGGEVFFLDFAHILQFFHLCSKKKMPPVQYVSIYAQSAWEGTLQLKPALDYDNMQKAISRPKNLKDILTHSALAVTDYPLVKDILSCYTEQQLTSKTSWIDDVFNFNTQKA
jgi:hypothetical protein